MHFFSLPNASAKSSNLLLLFLIINTICYKEIFIFFSFLASSFVTFDVLLDAGGRCFFLEGSWSTAHWICGCGTNVILSSLFKLVKYIVQLSTGWGFNRLFNSCGCGINMLFIVLFVVNRLKFLVLYTAYFKVILLVFILFKKIKQTTTSKSINRNFIVLR